MGRKDRRSSRRSGRHSKDNRRFFTPVVMWLALAIVLIAMVYGGWRLWQAFKGNLPPGTTPMTTQATTTTGISEATEPSTATAVPTQGETTAPAEPMTTAAAEVPQAERSVERTLALVGWALTDRHPDGFHSKYLDHRDMAAVIKAAMTLAQQNTLGFKLNLEKTDDPNLTMISAADANSLLGMLISGASLENSSAAGDLAPIGSGWAAALPAQTATPPEVYVVDREDTTDGQLVSFALVQPSDQGRTVLQTAMAEVRQGTGAYGYQVISWVTQDVPSFTKRNNEDGVTLSANVSQTVSALEILWGEEADKVTVTIEGESKTVDAVPGKRQVIILDKAVYTGEVVIRTEQADQIREISAY